MVTTLSTVVSLTSYPKRINLVHKTIQSLLRQNLKPGKIILWLAVEEFPHREKDLPTSITRLVDDRFNVCFYHNIRSYKKLIPTLKLYPDSVIITVDDDMVYGENLLDSLVSSYVKYPEMIHCCRCHLVQLGDDGNPLPYKKWLWNDSLTHIYPSYRNFFTGVGGVLYPPHSLCLDVFDEQKFNELCPDGDDVWFWAMAVLNGTLINRIDAYGRVKFGYIEGSQQDALWKTNKRYNDFMISKIFKYYPELGIRMRKIDPVYKKNLLGHLKQRVKTLLY